MAPKQRSINYPQLVCVAACLLTFLSLTQLTRLDGQFANLFNPRLEKPQRIHQEAAFSLDRVTADKLAAHLDTGALTSVALVEAYIDRAYESNEYLHAISELNPDALSIARGLDAERANGTVRGPLHGIPILIKDNIATLDELNTTAGSFALLGARVNHEAPVVTALRKAGEIVLGKATMGEWAQYRSTQATGSAGWSAYGQQPIGAWYPNQDPHGSSSGSAVAVSAGLAPLALGTETSGSIVNPAERNNLVGIKPTLGLVSRHMVIPISERQDTVGPIAKTVLDAATVLSVIAGPDANDNYTSAQPSALPDYIAACDPLGLWGSRIGIPRNVINHHLQPKLLPIMDEFEDVLRSLIQGGASLLDNANLRSYDPRSFHRNEGIVLAADFATGIKKYFDQLEVKPHSIHSLEDLRNFTWEHEHEAYPHRDTLVWDHDLERAVSPDSAASFDAYQANLKMGTDLGIEDALDSYDLDALILPTFAAFQLPAVAGLPVITVPLGFYPDEVELHRNPKGTMFTIAPGIPFGISFVGRKWSEETLIRLAYAFEQRTQVQASRLPMVLPKTDIELNTEGSTLNEEGDTSSVENSSRTIMAMPVASPASDALGSLDSSVELAIDVANDHLHANTGTGGYQFQAVLAVS